LATVAPFTFTLDLETELIVDGASPSLSRRYFLCRHYSQLSYASQYEQPWQRALRRVNKMKHRLGIDVEIGDPFPDKPKGKWVRTYGCLLDEMFHAKILAYEGQPNMLKRLAQTLMFAPGLSELLLAWWSTGSKGSWRSSRTILNEV
jgi:hypothetical protein